MSLPLIVCVQDFGERRGESSEVSGAVTGACLAGAGTYCFEEGWNGPEDEVYRVYEDEG